MITDNLFEKILLEPIKSGATDLYVVSGYSSPAIVYKHFEVAQKELSADITINLIIGMTPIEGIVKASHEQFIKLANRDYPANF